MALNTLNLAIYIYIFDIIAPLIRR